MKHLKQLCLDESHRKDNKEIIMNQYERMYDILINGINEAMTPQEMKDQEDRNRGSSDRASARATTSASKKPKKSGPIRTVLGKIWKKVTGGDGGDSGTPGGIGPGSRRS